MRVFAAQGAGRLFWPVCGVAARLAVGAGLGWLAVRGFGARPPALSWIIASSLLVYAATNALVFRERGVWDRTP